MTNAGTGRAATTCAQRLPTLGMLSGSSPRCNRGTVRANTLRPNSPSNAGNRLIAAATATKTATAAARPIVVSIGIRTTESAASAMTTVSPAKTTALPAVPVARPTA